MVELNIHNVDKEIALENLIKELIPKQNKKWVAGQDIVQYAGSYFDEKEFIAGVKTFLKGWLALGDDGIRFENKFPKHLGKEHGCLTNSGSSANLCGSRA